MTVNRTIALSLGALALVAMSSTGCKKNVDPAAFDAGATTAASATAAAPEETAAAVDPNASAAPLASLEAPKVVVAPKVVAPKPAASAAAAPKTIEACDKAKAICPNAGRASQSQCMAFTAECTKQGGHL